jgi:hypothetical protein
MMMKLPFGHDRLSSREVADNHRFVANELSTACPRIDQRVF